MSGTGPGPGPGPGGAVGEHEEIDENQSIQATLEQQNVNVTFPGEDAQVSEVEAQAALDSYSADVGKHSESIEIEHGLPYFGGQDEGAQQQQENLALAQTALQNPDLLSEFGITPDDIVSGMSSPVSEGGLGSRSIGTLATNPETTAGQTHQQQIALAQDLTSGQVDINDPIKSQDLAAIEASNTLGQMNPTLSMGISVVGGLISMAAGVPIGPGVVQTVLQGQPGVGASLTSALGFTPFGDQIAGITPPALLGMTDQSGDQDASVADPTEGIGPDMPTLAAPIGMTMQTPTTPTDFPPPLTFDEPVDPRPAALPVLLEPGTSISDLSADNILAEIQSNQITAERRRRAGAAASIRTSPSGAQVTSADVFRPSLFRVTQTLG